MAVKFEIFPKATKPSESTYMANSKVGTSDSEKTCGEIMFSDELYNVVIGVY